MRWLLVVLFMSLAALAQASTAPTLGGKSIDKVLVVKSERKLLLMNRGDILRSAAVVEGRCDARWDDLVPAQRQSALDDEGDAYDRGEDQSNDDDDFHECNSRPRAATEPAA